MIKIKTTKIKISTLPAVDQRQMDKVAEENRIKRLCPICDDLETWFEDELPAGVFHPNPNRRKKARVNF